MSTPQNAIIRLVFGKHRNLPLKLVPFGYLQWVIRECRNIAAPLRQAIAEELARRQAKAKRTAPVKVEVTP